MIIPKIMLTITAAFGIQKKPMQGKIIIMKIKQMTEIILIAIFPVEIISDRILEIIIAKGIPAVEAIEEEAEDIIIILRNSREMIGIITSIEAPEILIHMKIAVISTEAKGAAVIIISIIEIIIISKIIIKREIIMRIIIQAGVIIINKAQKILEIIITIIQKMIGLENITRKTQIKTWDGEMKQARKLSMIIIQFLIIILNWTMKKVTPINQNL